MTSLAVLTLAGDADRTDIPLRHAWSFLLKPVDKDEMKKSMVQGWEDLFSGSTILCDSWCKQVLEENEEFSPLVSRFKEYAVSCIRSRAGYALLTSPSPSELPPMGMSWRHSSNP